jgi:hypothetical protein
MNNNQANDSNSTNPIYTQTSERTFLAPGDTISGAIKVRSEQEERLVVEARKQPTVGRGRSSR